MITMRRAFLRARKSSARPIPQRTYVSASSLLAKPAAATAFAELSDVIDHSQALRQQKHLTLLPSPLPTDQPPTIESSSIYPSTALLDSLSLISVCLRRPETTPRAYDIFMRLLSSNESGTSALPAAAVWGSVIEGSGAMAKVVDFPHQKRMWTERAADLVGRWEKANGGGQVEGEATLRDEGVKVYRGWLRGALHAGTPLDPIMPYLASQSLKISDFTPAFKPSELPLVFDALTKIADKLRLDGIKMDIMYASGMEEERRENAAVEHIAEVLPVLENSTRGSKTAALEEAVTENEEGSKSEQTLYHMKPRWAIENLRKSLAELHTSDLPINRQHRLEAAALEAARAELQHGAEKMLENGMKDVIDSQKLSHDRLQAWMWDWLQALSKRIKEDMQVMQERKNRYTELVRNPPAKGTGPSPAELTRLKRTVTAEEDVILYLNLLPPEKLALITILETMRLAGSGGVTDGMKTLRAIVQIGKAIETEYRVVSLQDAMGKNPSNWLRSLTGASGVVPSQQPLNRRQIDSVWKRLGKQIRDASDPNEKRTDDELAEFIDKTENDPDVYNESTIAPIRSFWTPNWTQQTHLGVGSLLLEALVDEAKVVRKVKDENGDEHSEEQAAFSHTYDYVRGRKLGLIVLNPAVVSRIASDSLGLVIHPKHLPMLVPPRPWKAYDDGAYLHHRSSAMRFKENTEQQSYLKEASDRGQLEYVFAGLDVLSATPWAINRSVFDIVLKSWNDGDAIADIPASESKANYSKPIKPLADDPDPRARTKYVLEVKTLSRQMWKDHAERCKFNYNLEIARSYLNDTFYIPHNMDFRGRAYPIPPHLSPVGDDLCRGLLTFGEKKPLGSRGLMWLKIHLANVYGYDKASFKEREQFAEDHMEDVYDSADKPLDGKRWWLKAEDPWQCLAASIDLAAAIRSGDPESYMSSLPIHQDGTCNGMQHYAALGGDSRGAQAVNLEAGDKPADVYTGVADLVNLIIDRDAAAGKPIAQVVQGKVSRKVVKQSVMTTVYGVTFIGAKEQIAKQLIARGDISREHVFHGSAYIARTVLHCIGDLFGGATAIQDWLVTSARLISRLIPADRLERAAGKDQRKYRGVIIEEQRVFKELMTTVVWTTPLSLPVVQPYRKPVRKQVMTALQTVYISDPNATAEVAPAKQASAFPPNFIHSLDATHMLLTAMKCRQSGLIFASVHDSYWSHASSIDDMSKHIRQTFIELHSQDIIGDLRKEFLERYKNHRIPVDLAMMVIRSHRKRRAKSLEKDEEIIDADAEVEERELTTGNAMEEDLETNLPDEKAKPRLKNFGVRDLKDEQGNQILPEIIGGKKFLKLSDVLPPAPPRGEFDVNKIRLSPYFFS